MRYIIKILFIFLVGCQQDELSNKQKLSGQWIYEKEIQGNFSQLPDTLGVIEFEFVSDSTGLLHYYNVYTHTGESDKEKQKDFYYQDSFKVEDNFNYLTIIPGHLLRPIKFNIQKLSDTLTITSKNTTENYYKLEK